MNILSEYVAPWALPSEDIPIHLMWESSFSYDSIIVELPSNLQLKEFYNVDNYKQNDSSFFISRLKTPNFFGFSIATINIINEQHVSEEIKIKFIKNNNNIYTKIFNANIFRPYLSIIEPLKPIVIEDDVSKNFFDVKLKLSGFGIIQMDIDINTGGEFIEMAEPLYQEIVRRLISSFKSDDMDVENKGIKIDPKFLEKKAEEYAEKINKGVIPSDLNKENLIDFQNWLKEKNNKDKLMSLISKHVENLIVDSLIFYFEKYPTDNVQMTKGKPILYIEKATQKIILRFRYRDALKNEYTPILISTDVIDKRKNKNISLKFPINITWTYEIINPLTTC